MRLRVLVALLVTALLGDFLGAQGYVPPMLINLKDEGTLSGAISTIDCVGAGVSCAASAGTGTMTISGGAGGGNAVAVDVTLTYNSTLTTTTVTGQAWVTGTSKIVCQPFAVANGLVTLNDFFAAELSGIASNRVVGTGFDLTVRNPNGADGIFQFHCIGV